MPAKYFKVLVGAVLVGALSGCAHVFEVRVPEEFASKKIKEDPPPYAAGADTVAPSVAPGAPSQPGAAQ